MGVLSASIVHAIPGRLRVKLSEDEQNFDSAEAIDLKLSELEGVDEVTRNLTTGHLILHYDQCQGTNPKFFRSVAETLGVSPNDFAIDHLEASFGQIVHDQSNGNGVESSS